MAKEIWPTVPIMMDANTSSTTSGWTVQFRPRLFQDISCIV
jgi:hypothetical protein